jgi:Glycosyltransferase 61
MHVPECVGVTWRCVTMLDQNVVRAMSLTGRYFLRRMLGGNHRLFTGVSKRIMEVCAGHIVRTVKPFFLDAHLTRIRDTRHYTVREIVEEQLNRRTTELRPVRIHWVEDAWIVDGSVFVPGAQRIDLRNALEKRPLLHHYSLLPEAPLAELPDGVLAGSCAGSTWFGHWLEDEVPLLMLGCLHGKPVAHARSEFAHEAAYRSALGLPAPARFKLARIGMLAIVDEFAQNPSKTLRYQIMRRRLSRRPQGNGRIFLYRGSSGTPRNLINERLLAARLEKEGFAIIDVGGATFDELLRLCRGASLVVSVEGSQLAHALFTMKDYGTMLILCPPNQVHTTVAEIGVFCRLTSGLFVCEAANAPGQSGFYANPDEVLRFMDKLIAHGEKSTQSLSTYVDEILALAEAGGSSALAQGEAHGLVAQGV